jgi:predicted nucleic acid-binding protein
MSYIMTYRTILFDTNILIYAHNIDSKNHKTAKDLRNKVINGEIKGALSQQNLLEFFAVITDSRRLESPLSSHEALIEINNYINSGMFLIIYPNDKTLNITIQLAKKSKIRGSHFFSCYYDLQQYFCYLYR